MRTRPPSPGRLVSVAGSEVHVIVDGSGPVVVLESGLGGGVLEWGTVAAELAKTCTVVRRDRPGLGWSAPSSRDKRALAATSELHDLLDALGLPAPYVLVGHSLGALHVRAFADAHPDEVAAVVLVDPTPEHGLDQEPLWRRMTAVQRGVMGTLLALRLTPVLRKVYVRLMSAQLDRPLSLLSAHVLATTEQLADRSLLQTVLDEQRVFAASCHQAQSLAFPPVPLRVLSQGKPLGTTKGDAMVGRMRDVHHPAMTSLSPLGTLLRAERSGHLIPLEQPELVIQAVHDVLALSTTS